MHLFFFRRVGIWNHIFSDLIHFHLLWEWVVNTTTHQKKHCWYHTSTHHTQPHHQKCHTRKLGGSLAAKGSFAASGSLGAAVAAQQRGGGNCSLAVTGSLAALAAAQQRCGGSGSSVAAGS
jgi:hypothetical protein